MRSNRVASLTHALFCVIVFLAVSCTDRTPPERAQSSEVKREISLEPVASGLDTPWAIAFAPDGRTFVTLAIQRYNSVLSSARIAH